MQEPRVVICGAIAFARFVCFRVRLSYLRDRRLSTQEISKVVAMGFSRRVIYRICPLDEDNEYRYRASTIGNLP